MQKTALITGAARRIGAEIARILHENGLNVALHYHTSKSEAEKLCQELNAIRSHSAALFCADLTETAHLKKLVDDAAKTFGRLDLLVNNASRFYKTKIENVTEATWDDLMSANLKAPFFLSQAAVPYLKQHHGCIINLADIHAERPLYDYPVYSISKSGIVMLTKALAKELGPDIRVNAISPGETLWPEGEGNEISDELKQKIIKRIILKKKGDPREIAKAVLYLAHEADYITGQVLIVDGGRSLYM